MEQLYQVLELKLSQINLLSYGQRGHEVPGGELPYKNDNCTRRNFWKEALICQF